MPRSSINIYLPTIASSLYKPTHVYTKHMQLFTFSGSSLFFMQGHIHSGKSHVFAKYLPTYAHRKYCKHTLLYPHLTIVHTASVCSSCLLWIAKDTCTPLRVWIAHRRARWAPALSLMKDSSPAAHVTMHVPPQPAFPCNYMTVFLVVYKWACMWWCVGSRLGSLPVYSVFLCCFMHTFAFECEAWMLHVLVALS